MAPSFAEPVLADARLFASSRVLQIHLAEARIEVFLGCDRATLEIAVLCWLTSARSDSRPPDLLVN